MFVCRTVRDTRRPRLREAIASFAVLRGGAAAAGHVRDGRQPRARSSGTRSRCGSSRSITSIPDAASRAALLRRDGDATRRGPRRGLDVSRAASSRSGCYAKGLKQPSCEMCGQDELWRGRRLALILDHVNGVRDDNRLENLRIVCPNCAATLDTHCGRNVHAPARTARRCGAGFSPRARTAAPLLASTAARCRKRAGRSARARSVRRAAAVRAAAGRDRGDELERGRAQVRRVGQRRPQVGAGVRAGADGRERL